MSDTPTKNKNSLWGDFFNLLSLKTVHREKKPTLHYSQSDAELKVYANKTGYRFEGKKISTGETISGQMTQINSDSNVGNISLFWSQLCQWINDVDSLTEVVK